MSLKVAIQSLSQCFYCSLLDTETQGEHSFVKASSVGVKATAKNAKKNLVEYRELVATDFLELIALPDARSGHYRFDYEGINNLEEYLGAFQ